MVLTKFVALLIALSLSIITVLSDTIIKKASLESNVRNKWLLLGALIYALTAIGWVFVMKSMKLSTLWAIYGISCITILALVSVFVFHEKISYIEIFGILLGIVAITILYKFA
jgi:multidrug transporter EmrE-like cation transporter